jgi:hypothetical protein
MIDKTQISFLKRHLGAKQEDITKAIAAVGTKLENIEAYLLKQGLANFTYGEYKYKFRDRSPNSYL